MSVYGTGVDQSGIADLYRSLSKQLEQIVRLDVFHAPSPVVEDACQFAWDRLIDKREHIRRESALPWLARTATREALRAVSRDQRTISLDAALELQGDAILASVSPGADELAQQRERLRSLVSLPERQRRFLLLQVLGLNYAEIAKHIGCTERTVERQLLRARRTLREAAAD
jgi:RNA polymerase sigma factor (sigma-70 family)